MARFYPLYVRRSDGKLEVPVKGKRPEPNQPTPEQLDQTADKNGVSDFYREVPLDEAKHLDWRRKLGGMVAREMNWKDQTGKDSAGGYILADFPHGYRLFEHVKRTETSDGQTLVKSKNHAAGANDRQDAYLYGHPIGRKKRFRSPVEFFPHLFWLSTDETGDQDNCACRFCCPEDAETYGYVPAGKPKVESKTEKATKQEGDSKAAMVVIPALPSPRPTSAQPPSSKTGQDSKPQVTQPQQLLPAPLPQPKSTNQHIDRQYGQFMYRAGEMAWFQRGQAWGLGVILQRYITSAPSNQRYYIIQPLSHPFQHPPAVTKSSDRELRPWLAWSVPKFTNDGLNNLTKPARYETVDWQGVLQKRYGNGDMEVDGSILAAKAIDATYTPIGLIETSEMEPGVIVQTFDGIFIGAEKIWAGEPVRLVGASGTDILVIRDIVVRKHNTPGQPPVEDVVFLIGDVYSLTTVAHSNPNIPSPAAPHNNPHLPQRLTDDLTFRNARSIPIKGTVSYWKLTTSARQVGLDEIKGRWYEASLLLPILQTTFEENAQKGDISEASLWMNARSPTPNIRVNSRRDALGRAVPANADINDDLKPPAHPRENPAGNSLKIDPRFDTAEDVVVVQPTTTTATTHSAPSNHRDGMDDFMNLDGLDVQSQMPGFGQQYGGPAQGQYF